MTANGNTIIVIAKRCGQYCRRGLCRFVENEPFIQTVIKIFKFININRFWLILDMASFKKNLINIFYTVRYIIYNEIIKFCMKTIRHRYELIKISKWPKSGNTVCVCMVSRDYTILLNIKLMQFRLSFHKKNINSTYC